MVRRLTPISFVIFVLEMSCRRSLAELPSPALACSMSICLQGR
jgi:hypothetical protein